MHTLVIGGGIAGLMAAHALTREGADVRLVEAGPRVGGVIRSERAGGYLVEHGPNSLQARTPLLERTMEALGLERAVVEAQPAAKNRFIALDGHAHAVPMGPGAFLRTPLLSARAKALLLKEPFVRAGGDPEETVAAFVRRRLGPEVLDHLVNPFVAGVYAGDPERLSVRAAFPKLYELEQAHGSLLRGGLRAARARRRSGEPPAKRGLFSFRDGLETLPRALGAALGARVWTGTPVRSLTREGSRWVVEVERAGQAERLEADAVVWAAPLHALAAVEAPFGRDLGDVASVEHPPVNVMALGFPREAVAHPLDGFGLLVPAVERGVRVLGTLFSSSLFPGRAPGGHVLLTTFVGGARRPELAGVPDDELVEIVRSDLQALLGVQGAPAFRRCVRWPRAIPQYAVGYAAVQEALDRVENAWPGLHFAGSYRAGISVADAMASGHAAAMQVLNG